MESVTATKKLILRAPHGSRPLLEKIRAELRRS
jgi:hypothetical protein